MNSHQETEDDDIDRVMRAWGSDVGGQVSPSVRKNLMRRVARPQTQVPPRWALVLASAAGLLIMIGILWRSNKDGALESEPSVAISDPILDIQQLRKDSREALDELLLRAKLLDQELSLIRLQAKADEEWESLRRLEQSQQRRMNVDRVILASFSQSNSPNQP